MLGPMLHLCVLFIFMTDIDAETFADDNTPYMSAETTKGFVKSLERTGCRIFVKSLERTRCRSFVKSLESTG